MNKYIITYSKVCGSSTTLTHEKECFHIIFLSFFSRQNGKLGNSWSNSVLLSVLYKYAERIINWRKITYLTVYLSSFTHTLCVWKNILQWPRKFFHGFYRFRIYLPYWPPVKTFPNEDVIFWNGGWFFFVQNHLCREEPQYLCQMRERESHL